MGESLQQGGEKMILGALLCGVGLVSKTVGAVVSAKASILGKVVDCAVDTATTVVNVAAKAVDCVVDTVQTVAAKAVAVVDCVVDTVGGVVGAVVEQVGDICSTDSGGLDLPDVCGVVGVVENCVDGAIDLVGGLISAKVSLISGLFHC
ncbi:MAG: hypothetical protein LBR05_02945 [Azoarcus sp.]|nr:hypothetical protein [Azoarcus sp.]